MTTPIGFFDSGVGGLSVWREGVQWLPAEHTIYYADNAYCPYGAKAPDEIIARSMHIVDFLLKHECKLIVVACNTATAAAIDCLRARYAVPFVGMGPAVKPAAQHSVSGVVGVLATRGTFKGRFYHETLAQFAADVQVIEQPGDGLVELAEAGLTDSDEARALLQQYIQPMLDAGADYLVLGCTHYPFFLPAIARITGDRMTVIDPAPAVAQRIKFLLTQHNLLNTSGDEARHEFFSSGDLKMVRETAKWLMESMSRTEKPGDRDSMS
ncbi:MAG: glutamate racemase [Prevotellaceae bacterium]|jgi:glutamate racemase|nr:glutamate racemase [Prevotellaceae bacterium]